MRRFIGASVLVGITVSAHAQGSVTLYGILDEGFNFTNNVKGSKVYELQSGTLQGGRWGLSGSEDIGGGVKTVFKLESGYNINNGKLGQGGLMFGRAAWVGISSPTYGGVTLGRQWSSINDYLSQTTANWNWGGYLFSHPYDNDNTDGSFRLNNTVKYTSPSLAGLQFGGTYGFSNDTNFANNRAYSLGASYTNGGLLLAAAYLQANNPSATAGGAITNAADQNFANSRLRIFGAGATYTFGSAILGFSYSNTNMENPSSSSLVGSIKPTGGPLSKLIFQNFEVNGLYWVTPALNVGAMYTYTRAALSQASGNQHTNYQTAGLMTDYFVSKRTDVYLQGVYQHAGGDTTGSVLDMAYVVGADGVSSNRNQFVARVGIRHKF
jgi:predicted porin